MRLSAENLLARLSELDARTWALMARAERGGDLRTALLAIREARGNIEAYGRFVQPWVPADPPAVEAERNALQPLPVSDMRTVIKTLLGSGAFAATEHEQPQRHEENNGHEHQQQRDQRPAGS